VFGKRPTMQRFTELDGLAAMNLTSIRKESGCNL
jgi:hypothetical protein